ncbi:hypothetical protein [Robiginitalea sp. IMCC43444]|uniref:hypothetical protein n=1 Tax=Robiginitalea sp. IMCC43444 TaxID=3459121 RepID=UPI0040412EF6
MKIKILTHTAIFMVFGLLFIGCKEETKPIDTSAEKVQEAEKEVVAAKQDLADAIAVFQKESAAIITANEKRIAEIKLEIAEEAMDNRDEFRQELAKIEERNAQLKKKLSDYSSDGSQKLDAFKEEFNQDIKELGKAFGDLTVINTR